MKKPSTNRLKKLPLLLGTLLIISVAAYGTRAYFSDSASMQGDIKLELGTVDIKMDNTKTWTYTPLDNENNPNLSKSTTTDSDKKVLVTRDTLIENESSLTNVRPGDSFTRDFIVSNEGSLNALLSLAGTGGYKINFESDGVSTMPNHGPFTVKVKNMTIDNILVAGGTKTYTVTITVNPTQVDDSYNNSNQKDLDLTNIAFDYIEDSLTVKAIQTNTK